MMRATSIILTLFLVGVAPVSAVLGSTLYVCDPALSTSYCPNGKPDSTQVDLIPERYVKWFYGPATLDSALKVLVRYNSKEVDIVLKSGRRRSLRNFKITSDGITTGKGSFSFSATADTIRFSDMSRIHVEGSYELKNSLFLGSYLGGYGLLVGAAFDGLQYVGNRNTSLAGTIGTGIAGGLLGGILGYFLRDQFQVLIQPVLLDTNSAPY